MSKRRSVLTAAGAAVLVALAVWVWVMFPGALFPRRLRVVRPEPYEETDPLCWCRYHHSPDAISDVRHVARIEGTFGGGTVLEAALFHVSGGKVKMPMTIAARRSPNRAPDPPWLNMAVTLALWRQRDEFHNCTRLVSMGAPRGSGSGSGVEDEVAVVDRVFLDGPVERGREYLVYAEGDAKIDAARDMTPEEFAARNPGNRLLVAVRLG